ncbi:MAG: hypothetical protein R3316_11400 [Rhodovibrionaceae bacterium]|nr:hypothetical protein [Rhodovibrionaceae bacterium]
MLRDDKDVALDEVFEAGAVVVDGYRQAAELSESDDSRSAFERLAARRQATLDDLRARLLENDQLPADPDPEREALGLFIERVRALLSPEPSATVVEDRKAEERKLKHTVEKALGFDHSPDVAAKLNALSEEAEAALEELESLGGDQS